MQLVIAAITTSPSFSDEAEDFVRRFVDADRKLLNAAGAAVSGTRSCGRLGPATLGSTAERSISITAVNSAGGVAASRHNPCALQYASTRATCASSRPVNRR